MRQDTPWFKPRRTMTPPPSLRPCRRQFVPNIVDLVMRSVQKSRTPPANLKTEPTEPPHHESVADALNTFSVAEFVALGAAASGGDIPPNVALLASQLWSEVPSTGESVATQQVPVFGTKTPGPKETPRKRYFDKSELHHKVLAVLNKVTSDSSKYAEVRNELHRLPLPTATDDQLKNIAEIFFTKATTEPKFASEYAMLVAELAIMPPGKSVGDASKTLAHRIRTVLVSKCQSEFERTRRNLWNGEAADEAELDRMRNRYRETLRFVGHLYLHRILSKEVICGIVIEILPPDYLPTDYDVDGTCALISTVADQLLKDDADIIRGVLTRTSELASADLAPRSHCLILNLRDELTPKVPGHLVPTAVALAQPDRGFMSVDDALDEARMVFSELAASGDFERAVESLASSRDIIGVLRAGVGRALTTPRAERERQQLPTLFRYLVHRGVLPHTELQRVVFARACEAVETREWTTAPRIWKHFAQILLEDKEPHAVLHQTMHTDVLMEIALSVRFEPADVEQYIVTVLATQGEAVWRLDMTDPVVSPRFRFLCVIVATSSYDELGNGPVEMVRRVMARDLDDKSPPRRHDIEAVLFCAMCEGRFSDLFEEVVHHPHREALLMVQKVMGAILAAMVAMQDRTILDAGIDLLHLVVDGPDRGLREALILSEVVESGFRMLGQVRSSAYGFQIVKTLKDREVVSELTIQDAHRVYARHPSILHLLGPSVATPFVSATAITE